MPSIVSITSKTLYNSGKYGPSFFGYNNYVEGAGSGVIIASDDTSVELIEPEPESTEKNYTFKINNIGFDNVIEKNNSLIKNRYLSFKEIIPKMK